MSWQAYVDENLIGTGKVSKAAIFGLDGGLWAVTPGFSIEAAELDKLIKAFDDANDVQEKGLYLESQKYYYLRSSHNSVYARLGTTGVTCVKTNQAVLVGYYDESMQKAGECTMVVEALGDYLRSQGYVKAWEARGKLPHAIDSTASFVGAIVRDWSQTCSDQDLRLMYSMVFIRFVNGYVDGFQTSNSAKSIAYLAVEKVGMPKWFVELRHTATHDYLPSLTILRSAAQQALAWINDNYWMPQLVSVRLDETLSPEMISVMSDDVRQMIENYRNEKERQIDENSLPQPKQETHVISRLVRDLIKRCRSGDDLLKVLIPILLEPGMLVPKSKKMRASTRDLSLDSLKRMVDFCWMPLMNKIHLDLRGTSSSKDGEPISFWVSLTDGMLEKLIDANNAAQVAALPSATAEQKTAAKTGSYLITISPRLSFAAKASQLVAENAAVNQVPMFENDDIINIAEDCLQNIIVHVSHLIRSVLNTVIECDANIKEKISPILKQIDQRIVAASSSPSTPTTMTTIATVATTTTMTTETSSVGGKWLEGSSTPQEDTEMTDKDALEGGGKDTRMDENESNEEMEGSGGHESDIVSNQQNSEEWTLYDEDSWRPCPIGCLPGGIIPDLSLPWDLDVPPIARVMI
ncbi:profilin, required for normal timing of actin polymerization in response to thermal stress [Mortierella sp. AD011]|nr:profilin, required for normal timing of actin polymerization in response to thermal stress [Mortierella sp. AD010]KAF9402064.1 profilin, required for normal timing of actin polymerization in response to thermal stress [Mortierella sp. AD011]